MLPDDGIAVRAIATYVAALVSRPQLGGIAVRVIAIYVAVLVLFLAWWAARPPDEPP